MQNRTREQVWTNMHRILDRVFFAIIQVELHSGMACVLQSVDYPEKVGSCILWDDYLSIYKRFISEEQLADLYTDALLKKCQTGQEHFVKDISYEIESIREWLTMEVFMGPSDGKMYAAVVVRRSTEDHLLKSIIDTYVYNICDYFIYLDARNNSYVTLSASDNGTPLPPAESSDYYGDILEYINTYVVPEDREKTIYQVGLDHILEKLEESKTHSFSCGIMDPVRGYTRKRLEYRYYDRKTQMILLTRTDITETYMEEQEKQKELREQQAELEAALNRARTDSLTGVLNHQGIVDAIALRLERKEQISALLFIDLDNFKHVNDSQGHMMGDRLLKKISDALTTEVRAGDLVGRVGGDEFLVFLQDVKSAENVKVCAERLCAAVHKHSMALGCTVSCSIGVAVYPQDGENYGVLVRKADDRAYKAKAGGKNQVRLE